MKLAVNYLREVQELWEEGKIDFVDYFKLYSLNNDLSAMDWCTARRPVLFHGLIGEASSFGNVDLLEKTDRVAMERVIAQSRTPYLSGHISHIGEKQTEEETKQAILHNVKQLRKWFGKDILLENIPYRDRYEQDLYLLKPEIISEIVEACDCGFLFDISHARKAASYWNMPFDEYVKKLPMHRVVEFHLAGMYTTKDGVRMDYHGKMNEEDYEFLRQALQTYPTLQVITLEYGSYVPKERRTSMAVGEDLPLVDFDSVNPVAKEEVYEQLRKIKEIIEESQR